MAETTLSKYLDPRILNRIESLELKARLIVEGYISGLHRSPYRGFSVEFSQHREYVAGDDIRRVDWKVFGKSDRFYVKEYEEETNLTVTLALDTSESMSYGSGPVSKLEYACYVVASLAYLITQQQDAAGLALFDAEVTTLLDPRSSTAVVHEICHAISEATARQKTDLHGILAGLAKRIPRRGMVIVVSDLFGETDDILRGLRMLRQRGHEVVVFNVWDPEELTFPFQRMTRFEGMEELPHRTVDPRAIQQAYVEVVQDFLLTMRKGCASQRIDYVQLDTSQDLGVALAAYLGTRSRRVARVGH